MGHGWGSGRDGATLNAWAVVDKVQKRAMMLSLQASCFWGEIVSEYTMCSSVVGGIWAYSQLE